MPRDKPWDVCRHPRCHRPTWSGKKEPLLFLRHCTRHRPFSQTSSPNPSPAPPNPPKPRARPLSLPLVCVYKPTLEVRDPTTQDVLRTMLSTSAICGAAAPRAPEDRSRALYADAFGDPLCVRHRHHI